MLRCGESELGGPRLRRAPREVASARGQHLPSGRLVCRSWASGGLLLPDHRERGQSRAVTKATCRATYGRILKLSSGGLERPMSELRWAEVASTATGSALAHAFLLSQEPVRRSILRIKKLSPVKELRTSKATSFRGATRSRETGRVRSTCWCVVLDFGTVKVR